MRNGGVLMVALAILAVCIAITLLAGCAGIVAIDRGVGCSSSRSVEIIRTNGQPNTTKVRAERVCGPQPPSSDPIGDILAPRSR